MKKPSARGKKSKAESVQCRVTLHKLTRTIAESRADVFGASFGEVANKWLQDYFIYRGWMSEGGRLLDPMAGPPADPPGVSLVPVGPRAAALLRRLALARGVTIDVLLDSRDFEDFFAHALLNEERQGTPQNPARVPR